VTLDPQIFRCLALAFGMLFILASSHKLGDRARFGSILAEYRILPTALVPASALLISALELVIGCFWIGSVFTLQIMAAIPVASTLLLSIYGLAIAVNLARGRTHIDCGCSFSANRTDSDAGQQLSTGLVVRNLVLAAVALVPLLATSTRELTIMDHGLLVLITLVVVLYYAAFNQLLANRGAIASWRNSHA